MTSPDITDGRAFAQLSRLVACLVHNGRPGAKVIDRNGYTKVCRLAPEVEQEVQDARVLLAANGRHFE